MAQGGQELVYSIRWRVITRYFGQFCVIIAGLNLVTLGVALASAEFEIAVSYAITIGVLTVAGLLMSRVKSTARMQINEAMVLAALIFLVVPLVMTFPLLRNGLPFLDSFFETVSAVTTTGLSTLGSIEERSATLIFARSWMQWYGGLGIVVLSLALVVRPGMSAMRLGLLEAPEEDLVGGTRAHARRVLIVYTVLTCGGILVWLILGGTPWEGLLYVLAAVSTGGFAPTAGSLADLSGARLSWVVTVTCLAGAIPLALYHTAWRQGWRHFFRDIEMRALLVAGVLMSLILGICLLLQGMDLQGVLLHAPLMALSAQTTSGFSSLDPATLDAGSKAVLIVAMAIGGNVGSTAGGFKLLRLLLLFGLLYRCIKVMSVPPNAIVHQKLGGRQIATSEVQDALMIILLFIGVVIVSWLPFLMSGYAPLDALFEVVSATGTVGLSSGISRTELSAPLKLVLCADMLMGRLELVAWLVFFYPRTWFGRQRGVK